MPLPIRCPAPPPSRPCHGSAHAVASKGAPPHLPRTRLRPKRLSPKLAMSAPHKEHDYPPSLVPVRFPPAPACPPRRASAHTSRRKPHPCSSHLAHHPSPAFESCPPDPPKLPSLVVDIRSGTKQTVRLLPCRARPRSLPGPHPIPGCGEKGAAASRPPRNLRKLGGLPHCPSSPASEFGSDEPRHGAGRPARRSSPATHSTARHPRQTQ